jgi:5-methyltetrahydrofolate--homocysteine methyltransferase
MMGEAHMDILAYLKDHYVILDGGTGTQLQAAGLAPGCRSETWNLTRPEIIEGLHRAYYEAGAHVAAANTFGVNLFHYTPEEAEKLIAAALGLARAARDTADHPAFVALDMGPTGKLLKPLGDLDFEKAAENFAFLARMGEKYGADLVFIETMNDAMETKAALLAVRESTRLPVFVSNAYSENGHLMTGASPAAMVAMLEGMGADAIGVNCSFGPKELVPVVREYL